MKIKFPHPFIILLGFVVLSALATFIIPSGQYDRELNEETGREVVVPGSYHEIEDRNASVYDIFLSVPKGFIEGADIIVLILLLGSAFYVIEKTGALEAGLTALISTFGKAKSLLFYLLSVFFAVCGATFAMQEEIIALAPVLIIFSKRIDYDLRSVIAIVLGSSLIGASFSPLNPFGSLLALNTAELDPSEGFVFRLVFLGLAIFIWATYHIRAGKLNISKEAEKEAIKAEPLSARHRIILLLTLVGIGSMGWGIISQDWGFNEMSACFFAVGIAAGLVGKLGPNGVARAFTEGFSEMIFAGMIVGLARSVYLVLQDALIIDTIIYGLFQPLETLPAPLAVTGMMISNSLIHFPVPSTSGQALLTIPLAAPLTDLLGLSRQVAVFTYQYGAGLVDIFSPTNGGMMAVLAAAGINYDHWFKYIWKPVLIILGLGLAISILSIYWF